MSRVLTMIMVMSLTAVAVADVVYLADGRQITGAVSKTAGKVTIKTSDGKTLTFPATEVLYIASADKNSKTTMTKPAVDKPARSQPKQITPTKPAVPVSTARASMPETIVFNLLRHRPGGPGSGGAELEDSIRYFRAFVHDRRRKVNGKWLTPADFTRRRRAYEKKLSSAAEDFRHVPASSSTKKLTDAETLEMKRYQAAGRAKLQKAAGMWPDPLLRKFLLAEAARVSGNSAKAKAYFLQCVKNAPQIAAFQQGWALALMERKQYTEALKACMNLLKLQPDSRDALDLLRKTLKESPGRDIRTGVYKQAADMLEQYDTGRTSRKSRKSKKSIGWLLPGKRVAAKENSLPSPPMDRMVFRQCIAVPIAKNALLADSNVLDGASQIFIRIDKNTFVPIAIKKRRRTGKSKKDAPPLTVIEVVGYTFTPVTATKDAKLSTETSATAYGLNCLREMGGQVRTVPVKIESVTIKGEVNMTEALALVAGEAAGPVFDRKGQLLGFLAGKTDAMAEKTSNRLHTILDIEPLIKRAVKSSSRQTKRNKRNIPPKAVKGNTFLVMVIVCERFDGRK